MGETNTKIEIQDNAVNNGENINFFRLLARLTIEQLADKAKIIPVELEEYEKSGVTDPIILQQIADALEIGVSWLNKDLDYKTNGHFEQNGDNNILMHRNAQIHITYNYPVEHVENAYKMSLDILDKAKQQIIDEKDKQLKKYEEEYKKN